MATPITSTKRRQPGRKAEDIHFAWKNQAADAVFAGKPLAEMEAALAAVQQANGELIKLNQARSAAVKVRDEKLSSLTALARLVVRGVQAHPEYGEDSPLYRAMGFVPISERSSGLIRRNSEDAGTDAGDEEAAA